MASTETVRASTNDHVPTLPREVRLYAEDLREAAFTPRQLRAIAATLGRPYSVVMADAQSDERFLVMGWLKLQEEYGAFELELMDDVRILVTVLEDGSVEPRPDPLGDSSSSAGGSSTPS